MTNKVETFLKERILPDLVKGRPNWDKPHTICVVMKILQHESQNLEILYKLIIGR